MSELPDSNHPIQLNLWDWLEEAYQVARFQPDLVTVSDGVIALSQVMEKLADQPLPDQLALAALAVEQLTAVLEAKAIGWLDTFQADSLDSAPGLDLDPEDLAGLVRQSVSLDYDLFVEPPPAKLERQRPAADSTRVAPVAPSKILEMLDQLMSDPQFVQGQLALLAGGEEPGRWGEAIVQGWPVEQAQTQFSRLQASTGLAPVEIWLALLLGGYCLRPSDEAQFYSSDFEVLRP